MTLPNLTIRMLISKIMNVRYSCDNPCNIFDVYESQELTSLKCLAMLGVSPALCNIDGIFIAYHILGYSDIHGVMME